MAKPGGPVSWEGDTDVQRADIVHPAVEGPRVQVNATSFFGEDAQGCSSGFCDRQAERDVIGAVRLRF